MIKEFHGKYKWLSNFAPVKIVLDNRDYPNVEAAYMSAKSHDTEWKLFCMDKANTPGMIKKRSYLIELREDWEDVKMIVMKICVKQKFRQEPYMQMLSDTGVEHLQEGNMWNDKFWGVCLKTNTGKNMLGEMIMEIRDAL